MLFVKLKEDAAHHPKIEELAMILGVPFATAFGYVALFWLWCLKYAPDGNLSSFNARKIACGAKFAGQPPEAFLAGLVEAGLVDENEEGREVHDWRDHMSAIVRGVERNAQKCKNYRARAKANKSAALQDQPGVATKTTPSQTETETETFSISNEIHSASVPDAQSASEETPVEQPKPGKVKKIKQPKAELANVPGFNEFWDLYPRKKDKQRTETTWAKLTDEKKIEVFEGLKRLLPGYLAEIANGRGCYLKYPTTWLNAGSYADEVDGATITTTDVANHNAGGDEAFIAWTENYAEQRRKKSPGEFIQYVSVMQERRGVTVDGAAMADAWANHDTDGERVEAALRAIYDAKVAAAK